MWAPLGLECCAENDCPVFGCSAYNRNYQRPDGSSLIQSVSQWRSEDDRKHSGENVLGDQAR